MFKVFVRPCLEYACESWSPYLNRDVELLERVQRLFTRRLPCFDSQTYEQRLSFLELETLKRRRTIRDLVMTYKIIHGHVNLNFDLFFEYAPNVGTRGHSYKLLVKRSRLDIRKHFFAIRIVPVWNSLPASVVDSETPQIFKSRLDSVVIP